MLLINPPYLQSGRLTVFKDDKDVNMFYYACSEPKIALNEAGKPKLFASAILPETGVMATGKSAIVEATISMDVELNPTEQELELAKEAVKEQWGEQAKIFSPAPIIDGNVYMLVAAAGSEPKPDEFYISPKVSPTIIGNNTASLMAKAEGLHATNLIAALNEDLFTASIFYELNMLGITPSFKAKMTIDWEKVYSHFEETKKIDYIFAKKEIQNSVHSLEETKAIDIEIEELDPETKNAAIRQLFDELSEKIIEKVFDPAPMPKATASDIADGASRIISALLPGAHHIRKNKQEVQTASTTLDISERNARKFSFYPQALLTGLLQEVGGIKDDIEWIKLDDMPFRSKVVDVSLAAETFKTANIKSVKLDCRVTKKSNKEVEKTQSFIFNEAEKLNQKFNFIKQHDEDYLYSYRASVFLDTGYNELPSKLNLDWNEANGAFIYFNAAEYFKPTELTVGVDDSSIFQHCQMVQVDVDVFLQQDNIHVTQKTFILDKDKVEYEKFQMISSKESKLINDVSVTYFLKDAPEYTEKYSNYTEKFFFVKNPFENKWNSEISVVADWETMSKLITEFRVFDFAREEYILYKHHFTKEAENYILQVTSSIGTPKSEFEYRVTAVRSDGTIDRSSWKKHRGPALMISGTFESKRTIRATLTQSPDFEEKDIRKATIQFRYNDGNSVDVESEKLRFTQLGHTVEFTHKMPNHNQQEYHYRLMVFGNKGERFKTDWISKLADDIKVKLLEDIW